MRALIYTLSLEKTQVPETSALVENIQTAAFRSVIEDSAPPQTEVPQLSLGTGLFKIPEEKPLNCALSLIKGWMYSGAAEHEVTSSF